MAERRKNIHFWIALSLAMFVLVVFFGGWMMIDWWVDEESKGTFGDQFGAVNTLFSGFAFAGMIYTIILQNDELRLQREELQLTRKEMSDQTDEFEEQNGTFRIQRFENTFFQMLNLHQEIVNGLRFSYVRPAQETEIIAGRELFFRAFEDLEQSSGGRKASSMRAILEKWGMDGYADAEMLVSFDHYFRYLYRILKFVDESPLIKGFETRYQYTSIVRGQLSVYELVWLYYNGVSRHRGGRFKLLMERYALLKDLPKELLVDAEQAVGVYALSAFEKTAEQS